MSISSAVQQEARFVETVPLMALSTPDDPSSPNFDCEEGVTRSILEHRPLLQDNSIKKQTSGAYDWRPVFPKCKSPRELLLSRVKRGCFIRGRLRKAAIQRPGARSRCFTDDEVELYNNARLAYWPCYGPTTNAIGIIRPLKSFRLVPGCRIRASPSDPGMN